uniref:L1 transposable element RRM domain-containing protein n=1 Tax=Xiphophorus couchianus TaxID=32473 RepID=A0A3B5M6N4_9TELE
MSLDNFFVPAASSKKKKGGPKGGANASIPAASQNDQDDVAEDMEQGSIESDVEEANTLKEDIIVERVTKNIEEILDRKVAAILKPVSELAEKFDSMTRRMAAAEQRISDLEDVTTKSAPRMDGMEKTIERALERLDSLENQSRRQNIKIMGLKEGIEGREPAAFFEEWIPKVLGLQQTQIKIERAHRTGPQVGRSDRDHPRAVLVRLHNYIDKQKILNAARNKGIIQVEDRRVSFYQDFSAEIVRKRQESSGARRQLREAGVRYAFLFPAVIKIFNQNGTTTSLSDMKEINEFIKTLHK